MIKPKTLKYIVSETGINFLSWNLIAEGFFNHRISRKYTGAILNVAIMYIKNDVGQWAPDILEWNNAGDKLLKRIAAGKLDLKRLISEHHKAGRGIFKACKSLKKILAAGYTRKRLSVSFKRLWSHYFRLNSLGFVPVISDYDNSALTTKLTRILKTRGVNDSNMQKYLSVLSSRTRPVLNWKEQLDLLVLASNYHSLLAIKKSKAFIDHVDKYSWLNYGYQGPKWGERDFLERIKAIFASHVSISQQLKRHREHFKRIKKQQRAILSLLKLTRGEKSHFTAAKEFMYLKAYRTVCRHLLNYTSDLIFARLAREFHLPITTFRYALKKEILDWLADKNPDFRNAAKRRKEMLYVNEGKKRYFVKPEKIQGFLKPLLIDEKIGALDDIAGQSAYLGKVRGRVKIVNSRMDIAKVKKGDILVAVSTNPDVLPAMNRVAGFVTDVGGITSHAAIVAREMKKTCVIGTKFATKVLKDGMIVEVDANLGIVKIIK